VANPSFTLVKVFDFMVNDFDEDGVEDGLPILGAILLHQDEQFGLYCFSATRADARAQIKAMCQTATTPLALGDVVDQLLTLARRLGGELSRRHELGAWKTVFQLIKKGSSPRIL
jgi:hypothetical protein